jgi:hypothetical protein
MAFGILDFMPSRPGEFHAETGSPGRSPYPGSH